MTPRPDATSAAAASAGRLLLGGLLTMAMVMGIGRFYYTPILPIMQDDFGLSSGTLGLIASVNFAGYLAGSVAASAISAGPARLWAFRIGAVASVVTTAGMGLTDDLIAWYVLRGVSGVASALAMISAAGIVAEALARVDEPGRLGWMFGGVGFGIAVSGTMVRLTGGVLDSPGLWLMAGALSGLMLPVVLIEVRERALPVRPRVQARQRRVPRPLSLWAMLVNYSCEGLGYSVFATFIVAIVKARPGGEVLGDWVWVIAGLSALPATLLWMRLAENIGFATALICAYVLQIVGVVLPALSASGPAALVAAVLFGGTFTSITALTMPLSRHGAGGRGFAIVTAGFGVGQMLGPGLAGYLVELSPAFGFGTALLGSAGVLAFGLAFLLYAVATRRDLAAA